MTEMTLYKYHRADGGLTVSPVMPPDGTVCTTAFRLVAGDGEMITADGKQLFFCVDLDSTDGWYAVPVTETNTYES